MIEMLKKRTVSICNVTKTEGENSLCDALEGIFGVIEAKFTGPERLRIQYDLTKLHFGQIEENIRVSGFELADGFLARWKRSWTDFTEENVYNNMMSDPLPVARTRKGSFQRHAEKTSPLLVSTLAKTTKERP